jgi:5-methylcytosine-specific restriction endonuclease McrA
MDKRDRKPQPRKTRECAGCGEIIVIDPKRNFSAKFCSHACYAKKQKGRNGGNLKRKCAACHAAMGMTGAASGRLIGISKAHIARIRKEDGLRRLDSKTARSLAKDPESRNWWGDTHAAKSWLSEYSPKFPDWSPIASHEMAKAKGRQYQSMMHRTVAKDHPYRLKKIVRSRLYNAIKRSNRDIKPRIAKRTTEMLGCTMEQFKRHIESKFKRGMTWDNHGEAWHIDHIVPLSHFDFTNETQFASATHYTNLQPLWASQNLRKGDRITQNHQLCMPLATPG